MGPWSDGGTSGLEREASLCQAGSERQRGKDIVPQGGTERMFLGRETSNFPLPSGHSLARRIKLITLNYKKRKDTATTQKNIKKKK